MKRYRVIVVDGTSCGILADLPDYDRDNLRLTGSYSTGRKFLVTKKEEKRILKHLFNLTDRHIKLIVRKASTPKYVYLQQKGSGLEIRDLQ